MAPWAAPNLPGELLDFRIFQSWATWRLDMAPNNAILQIAQRPSEQLALAH